MSRSGEEDMKRKREESEYPEISPALQASIAACYWVLRAFKLQGEFSWKKQDTLDRLRSELKIGNSLYSRVKTKADRDDQSGQVFLGESRPLKKTKVTSDTSEDGATSRKQQNQKASSYDELPNTVKQEDDVDRRNEKQRRNARPNAKGGADVEPPITKGSSSAPDSAVAKSRDGAKLSTAARENSANNRDPHPSRQPRNSSRPKASTTPDPVTDTSAALQSRPARSRPSSAGRGGSPTGSAYGSGAGGGVRAKSLNRYDDDEHATRSPASDREQPSHSRSPADRYKTEVSDSDDKRAQPIAVTIEQKMRILKELQEQISQAEAQNNPDELERLKRDLQTQKELIQKQLADLGMSDDDDEEEEDDSASEGDRSMPDREEPTDDREDCSGRDSAAWPSAADRDADSD